jgi:hypothetical protein
MGKWLVALVTPCLLTIGAGSSSPGAFNLTPPVRLVDTSMYADGGTVYFVLVGAQSETLRGGMDGGMKTGDMTCPLHCFVGGDYPTKPGVRLLPLWGSEERKLVDLLMTVVRNMGSPDEVQSLLKARSGAEVPSKFRGKGKWIFASAVNRRKQTLDAIDHGMLASPEDANRAFSGADTAHVKELVRDLKTGRFLITFPSANGEDIRFGFPASPDSFMNPSSFAGRKFDSRYVAGSSEDRRFMTYVMMTLRSDRASSVDQRDREDLLEILRQRRAKILEADTRC